MIRTVLSIIGIFTAACICLGGLFVYSLTRETVLNRQVFKRGAIEVHSTHTRSGFDTQCVRFESQAPSSATLQYVFESCGDLVEDFSSEDDLHFLGDQKAYLIYGWYFAVTVDSGKSWSVWDGWNGELCEQKKMLCFPDSKTVRIRQDGTGSMEIYAGNLPGMPESSGTFLLTTRDFGQTWRLVSESK